MNQASTPKTNINALQNVSYRCAALHSYSLKLAGERNYRYDEIIGRRDWMKALSWIILFVGIVSIFGCDRNIDSLEVTATAYTSSTDETNANPSLAAWGDTLKPGMKAISVSEDLIKKGY